MLSIKRCFICINLLLTLTACETHWGLGLASDSYVPDVNLKGDARRLYQQDVAICQKQILQQYGDKHTTNNAIVDLRRCLIDKGYVLLS